MDSNARPPVTTRSKLGVVCAVLLLNATPLIDGLLNHGWLFPENELRTAALFIVFFGCCIQSLWGIVILGAIAALCLKYRRYRFFMILTLGLTGVLISMSFFQYIHSPPTAASAFKGVFRAAMPASAHSIRVQGPTLADSNILYFFACSKEDTQGLVKALGMMEENLSQEDYSEHLMFPLSTTWPDDSLWRKKRLFSRRDGATGRVDSLVCDDTETQVYVYKDPLASKTDADLGLSPSNVEPR